MIYDAVIIGAGLIGKMVAAELSKYKVNIAVLEKRKETFVPNLSNSDFSIIHGGYSQENNFLTDYISYESRMLLEEISQHLDFDYKKTGSFLLGRTSEEREIIESFYSEKNHEFIKDCELLSKKKLDNLKMDLGDSQIKSALFCSGTAICSSQKLSLELKNFSKNNGIKYFYGSKVINIEKYSDFYKISTTNSNYSDFLCRVIINCTGILGDKISEMVDDPYYNITLHKKNPILKKPLEFSSTNSLIYDLPNPENIDKRLFIASDGQDLKLFSGINNIIVKNSIHKTFINVGDTSFGGITFAPIIAKNILDILKNEHFTLLKK